MTHDTELPMGSRPIENVAGHWVLARMGKKVLRPGGRELTERMLGAVPVEGRDVVELAPGLGLTARAILDLGPASYTGVDENPEAATIVRSVVEPFGRVVNGDAAHTGLPDDSADVIVGEAMLTMQTDRGKSAIIGEACRVLRPGGHYAIHELGLKPDDVSDDIKNTVRVDLARAIKVNARPLTLVEWRAALEAHGLEVVFAGTAPMALLDPKRVVADEGVRGALRMIVNVLRNRRARARVLGMRRVFRTHRDTLTAVAMVARRPLGDDTEKENEE
ncbi:MAG: class I SAM-dependent methyltransferase [Propioniciclava sp.]|uniref:class I SAM-dependent methyltransferase n=1 Tax=Propioniciclava sp. TaxID=2038686 RepID=UPI0039E56764